MEDIIYEEDFFQVPSGLSDDFSNLLEIISPETWNNILTDEHRKMLMKFLPDFPEEDLNEKTHTLEMFFMNENFYFGSPLQKFFLNLKQGHYNPDVTKMRKIYRKILHKSYKYRQRKRFHHLLEEILVKRKELLDGSVDQAFDSEPTPQQSSVTVLSKREVCLQRTRKRYFKELKAVKAEAGCDSDISEDDNYPEGVGVSLNKKQRRQAFLLEGSFPAHLCPVRPTHTRGSLALDLEANLVSARNPFDSSEDQFRSLLALHLANQKKNWPSMDTRGITLKSILERTETLSRKPIPRPAHASPLPSLYSATSASLPSRPLPSPLPLLTSHSNSSSRKTPTRKRLKPSSVSSAAASLASGGGVCSTSPPLIPSDCIKRELSSDSYSSEGEMMPDLDVCKDEFPNSFEHSSAEDVKSSLPSPSQLTQETHVSFFSLLRDVVCSTREQRMRRDQLVSSVSSWQESAISPLNEWFCLAESWVQCLASAVNFLCGSVASDLLPSDFVPFIEYKGVSKLFQWIGAGRDSDANFEPLCQYWINNRDNINSDWPKESAGSGGGGAALPSSSACSDTEEGKTGGPLSGGHSPMKSWALRPAGPEDEVKERSEYHQQERNRYEQPHKAFRYRLNGYESVIGPVKGVYTQHAANTTKARGHLLLVPDRPPYVTILSLVWDSVARLPNSEGTKLDICELLKESQFLVPIQSPHLESTLNSVVSGALDRLQNEKDPCVKFDTSRKLWVYLHKCRSEKELEMMHQLKFRNGGGKSKAQSASVRGKSVKKREDPALNQGPPNVVMEQYSPAIKQMDGSEVRIKDEDLLKNWVKISSSSSPSVAPSSVSSSSSSAKARKKERGGANTAISSSSSSSSPQFKMRNINLINFDGSAVGGGSQAMLPFGGCARQQAPDEGKELSNDGVSPQKVCSSLQFSKGGISSLLHHSSSSASGGGKPSLHPQSSRKYQSSSEKKILKSGGGSSTAPPSPQPPHPPSPTTKLFHTQPTNSSATSVMAQSKGIKLLQYSNPNLQGKGVTVGNASLMVDTSSSGLVGQKLVVAGNRVLVQGGKVLHNVTAAGVGSRGKQVLAGVVPAQHIMAVNSLKKGGGEHHQQGVEGGRFIQIATVDAPSGYPKQGGYQKLTFVPQFSQATLTAATTTAAQKDLHALSTSGVVAKGGNITTAELKLKLGSAAAFATASGNIISLGGKQILLTTKGTAANRAPQIHQVVVGDSRSRVDVAVSDALRGATSTQQQIMVPVSASSQQGGTVVTASSSGQQVVATTSGGVSHQQRLGIGTQQIVVPASALTGSSLNLKRLQAFQSFKVVPASQLTQQQQQQQQRGKPVVAHILAPSSTTSTGSITTTKLAFQLAPQTDSTQERK